MAPPRKRSFARTASGGARKRESICLFSHSECSFELCLMNPSNWMKVGPAQRAARRQTLHEVVQASLSSRAASPEYRLNHRELGNAGGLRIYSIHSSCLRTETRASCKSPQNMRRFCYYTRAFRNLYERDLNADEVEREGTFQSFHIRAHVFPFCQV